MFSKEPLKLPAPAKVNLTLHVLEKRADGYHELETWMQKISLFDWVILQLLDEPGIHLSSTSEEVPLDETNLVWSAAKLFFDNCDKTTSYGLSIELEKNIPVAAGLGGGSSDAGTVLKGLNILFEKPFSEKKLLEMGLELGADVPFFVTNHDAVLAKGVGEKMTPMDSLAQVSLVVVNPNISVSTKWVFENFVLTESKEKCNLSGFSVADETTFDLTALHNDLELVTEAKHPVIKEIKSALIESGAQYALMSGSGPTVFGIFPDSNKNGCNSIDDAVKTMRFRFGNKVYKAKTSAGA